MNAPLDPVIAQIIPQLPLRDPETMTPQSARDALRVCRAPVVAVSPIIGGKAVKGPTAKIMAELGLPVGAAAVARHYEDILDVFIVLNPDKLLCARRAAPQTVTPPARWTS